MSDRRRNERGTPERAALLGLLVNLSLAAAKLAAGIFGHSFALVADAIESMADILGSLVVWQGLRFGAKPPDEGHPFGHGKAESLAALAVGLLVFGAGLAIGAQSIRGILTPQRTPEWYTLAVLLAVIVIKETMFRVARQAAGGAASVEARGGASSAGMADAWHHRSDAITSAAAFVGISVALVGGYAPADDWAALAASLVIVVNGVLLTRAPLAELMDEAAPEVSRRCEEIVLGIEGFEDVEQCEARKVGRSYRIVMHAEVAPSMSVAAAHALTGKAKAAVRAELPEVSSLLIHVEPHGEERSPVAE